MKLIKLAASVLTIAVSVNGSFLVRSAKADTNQPPANSTMTTTDNSIHDAKKTGIGYCGTGVNGGNQQQEPVNSYQGNSPTSAKLTPQANSGCNTTTTTSNSNSESAAKAAAAQFLSSNPKATATDLSSHLQSIGFAPSIATSVANSLGLSSSNAATTGPQSQQTGINAGNSSDVYNSRTLVNPAGTRLNVGLSANIDLLGRISSCDSRVIMGSGALGQMIKNLAGDIHHDRNMRSRLMDQVEEDFINGKVSATEYAAKQDRMDQVLGNRFLQLREAYGDEAVQKLAAQCSPNQQQPSAPPVFYYTPTPNPATPVVKTETPPAPPQEPTTPSKLF